MFVRKVAGQFIAYLLFAIFIGYLSFRPVYTHLDPELALIKLSFSHAGAHREACRRLTQEELDALAPNMRRLEECSRERVPLVIELDIDGINIYSDILPPSGLAGDGASTVYRRFPVESGRKTIAVRLRDSRREDGFDWHHEATVELNAGKIQVIDFRPDTGGFVLL